jgi:hypothetical protein
VKVHKLCDADADGLDMDEETRRVREVRRKGKSMKELVIS